MPAFIDPARNDPLAQAHGPRIALHGEAKIERTFIEKSPDSKTHGRCPRNTEPLGVAQEPRPIAAKRSDRCLHLGDACHSSTRIDGERMKARETILRFIPKAVKDRGACALGDPSPEPSI